MSDTPEHPDCSDCPGRGTCPCDLSDVFKAPRVTEQPDTAAILIAYGQARVERRHLEADQMVVDLATALDAARAERDGWRNAADASTVDALRRAEAAEAEVRRLREVNEKNAVSYMDSLNMVSENLAFAQQRAADNGLRAEIGERKIIDLVAEIRDLKAARDAWSTKARDLEGLTEQLFDEREALEACIAAALKLTKRIGRSAQGEYERGYVSALEDFKRVLTKETPNA